MFSLITISILGLYNSGPLLVSGSATTDATKPASQEAPSICKEDCPKLPEGMILEVYGKSCFGFAISDEFLKLHVEAEAYCRRNEGHLVSIESQEVNDFIARTMKDNNFLVHPDDSVVWIGFNDTDSGKWIDGSIVTYKNWPLDKGQDTTGLSKLIQHAKDALDGGVYRLKHMGKGRRKPHCAVLQFPGGLWTKQDCELEYLKSQKTIDNEHRFICRYEVDQAKVQADKDCKTTTSETSKEP